MGNIRYRHITLQKYHPKKSLKYDMIDKCPRGVGVLVGGGGGGCAEVLKDIFRSSTRWPFHLSPTQDMQVEMINRLTGIRAIVYDNTKTIKNTFFLGYNFGSIEKLTQYLSMPCFSLPELCQSIPKLWND